MPLFTDWGNQLILVTAPTVKVSGQELHDFIEDQMATPVGSLNDDIINPEGKIEDPSNPGIYSQIILIFNSPWQIQFWQGSGYTELYGAKVVGGLNDRPFKATGFAGDITILNSPVDGVTVATGSGLSTEQDTKLTEVHRSHFHRRYHNKITHKIYIYDTDNVTVLHEFDESDDLANIIPV